MLLLFAFIAFVCSVATSVCVAGSGVGSFVGILSRFIIGNNLLLKVLRTFSLVVNNNPKLSKTEFLSRAFVPLSKYFKSIAKLLCLLPAPSIDKFPTCISL